MLWYIQPQLKPWIRRTDSKTSKMIQWTTTNIFHISSLLRTIISYCCSLVWRDIILSVIFPYHFINSSWSNIPIWIVYMCIIAWLSNPSQISSVFDIQKLIFNEKHVGWELLCYISMFFSCSAIIAAFQNHLETSIVFAWENRYSIFLFSNFHRISRICKVNKNVRYTYILVMLLMMYSTEL